MFHSANYLREFIPDFHRSTAPLKPYSAKGAKWETYLQDKVAQKATQELRMSVANETPLVNPDFKAAFQLHHNGQAVPALRGRKRLRVQWRASPGTGHPRHSEAHRSALKVLR